MRVNNRSSAILGIGNVNTKTGKNTMCGKVWDCWEEDPNAENILLRNSSTGRIIAAHSSGKIGWADFESHDFHADQSCRDMGSFVVLGSFPHTAQGLLDLGVKAGKTSVPFYTFK